ncbi:MAG TPA: VOC family protein [Limnochordales bacterium]
MADPSQGPQVGHIGEIEITARDPEKVRAFLESVFGWKVAEYGSDIMTFASSDAGVGGHIVRWPHQEPTYVTFYVKVDDIKATVERVVKAGGTVLVPEGEIPGGGHFALFTDPEGHPMGVYTET